MLSPQTWNTEFSLLFIDNPVGAGFSYTGTGTGYATDQTAVANDLYAMMLQFYKVEITE
jgi:vitellogenic carboxypeptidase-like protein